MGASDARERSILDSIFGSGTPATWYVGGSRAFSGDDGSGFNEPTGIGAYARVAVTNNVTNWPSATTVGGRTTKKNANNITFPNPTASLGQFVEIGFFTTLTGGTPEITQRLDDPITVSAGNTPVQIDANELEIECD